MEGSLPEKTCRTCLQESDELTSLYAKDHDSGHTLLEMLRFCTSLEVLESEHTPSNTCTKCARCIVEYYDFKQRCELSEKTLEDLNGVPSEYILAKVVAEDDDLTFIIKTETDDCNLSFEELVDGNTTQTERDSGDHDDGQNTCPLCGERFKSAEERPARVLFCRFEDETGENQLRCKMCKETFDFQADLSEHILLHITEHPFECDACGELLDTKSELQTHVCECPEDESPSNDAGSGLTADVVECLESDDPNLLAKDDQANLDDSKKNEPSNAKLQLPKRRIQRYKTPAQDHLCHHCGTAFRSSFRLGIHIKENHSAERPVYVCDICGKTYNFRKSLFRHKHSHQTPKIDKPKFICDQCGREFGNLSWLRTHVKESHGAEKMVYECEVCGKTYNFYSSWFAHKYTHNAANIDCDYCERKFPSKARLRQHVRTTHKKRYVCDDCGKLFPDKVRLKHHKAQHLRARGKPYECSVCDKRFSTTAAVTFHVDSQHKGAKKQLKCDVCGAEFYNRFHYAAHYSQHTGVKPCQCDGCGKGYNYNKDLMLHKKKCGSLLELARQSETRNSS